jgi:protoporphyrinogen oxidase
MSDKPVLIIGAGPAGLTAGYLLSKVGVPVTIIESDTTYVGGISRTVTYKGFHFDIGGHRFFSKSQEVENLWSELLPNDFLIRPRLSRIYYRGQFFSYPLKAFDALQKLGVVESALCMLSYAKARLFPKRNPKNLEEWVSNQFGWRLFSIFFKTYTEKVWGMSCKEISADWAAQRIKGLSLSSAIFHALGFKKSDGKKVIKTLIDSFRYPRRGPGMMWQACAEKIHVAGGDVHMGQSVHACRYDAATKIWHVSAQDTSGQSHTYEGSHVISSAPLRQLVAGLTPPVSAKVREAAQALRYRDFLVVGLIVKDRDRFADNWIYIHDPSVKVGRIQNFKSWSPEMVPDPQFNCYGMEYFCFEGDGLWSSKDADLIELAKDELVKIGLVAREDILDGCVIRQKKAYPVYDDLYQKRVDEIRSELEKMFPTLHLVGRNGMHKYNNQDHAMMTAMIAAKNILAGRKVMDPWKVNQDAEYHETETESGGSALRAVPTRSAS